MARLGYLAAFAITAIGALAFAQDAPVVFRSEVALARVDAQVVDRDNRAITGLTREDFVLRQNGHVQDIKNFASEDMPVDVLLLLDVSRSMRSHVQRLSEASHEALRALGPNDRVAVMVFDRSTRVRMPFRGNRTDIQRGLDSVLEREDFEGGTDITRGLLDAASYIGREGRREARRAIVILTDDQTEFDRNEEGVIRSMNNNGVVVSALLAPDAMGTGGYGGGRGGGYPRGGNGGGMGSPFPGGPLGDIIFGRRNPSGGRYPGGGGGGGPVVIGGRTRSAGTAQIAERTGGDSMRVDDASAFETTLERIRQRYALHFNLADAARARDDLDVTLTAAARRRYPDAQVRFHRVSITGDAVPTDADDPVVASTSEPVSTTDADPDRPKFKRRPGVSERSGTGPRIEGSQDDSAASAPASGSSSQQKGGWRRVGDPEPAGVEPSDGAPSPSTNGGWRKVKPGEKP